MFFSKVWAFIKRDLRIDTSYRLSYIFQLGGVLSSLLTFFFISKLMGKNSLLDIQGYGGDYFSFVIIGIAFSKYQTTAMNVSNILSEEQESGTLESLLLTPTKTSTIITAGASYGMIDTSLIVLCYMLAGIFLFNMTIGNISILAALLVIILSITSFMGIGLISTGFIMIFKRGDPLAWFFGSISKFLGGVFFPVTLLPEWTQKISALLPITYSLEAMRGIILNGKGITELTMEIAVLSLFSIIFLSTGIPFLQYAINRCKKEGSLTHL